MIRHHFTTGLLVVVALLGLAAAWGAPMRAQAKPASDKADPAPTLTSEQKTTIENIVLRIDNAQLRAQVAQGEFDRARAELTTTVQALQKDGYDLDLQSLRYVKKPPVAK